VHRVCQVFNKRFSEVAERKLLLTLGQSLLYIYIYKLLLTTQQILGTTYNTSTQGICVNEEFGGAECTAYRLLRG
jgi:hypothetical protein